MPFAKNSGGPVTVRSNTAGVRFASTVQPTTRTRASDLLGVLVCGECRAAVGTWLFDVVEPCLAAPGGLAVVATEAGAVVVRQRLVLGATVVADSLDRLSVGPHVAPVLLVPFAARIASVPLWRSSDSLLDVLSALLATLGVHVAGEVHRARQAVEITRVVVEGVFVLVVDVVPFGDSPLWCSHTT